MVPERVDLPVFDEVTGEQTGTETVPDPDTVAILEKDAEDRAEAQAVIDATPQAVKDFAANM